MKNKLYVKLIIKGLENIKNVGANETIHLNSNCTNKTSVMVNILES